MKVFWLFNHPAPYKVNFFNILGKSCELNVLFERDSEAGRNAVFYSQEPLSFHAKIAKSLKLGGINNYTKEPIAYLKDNSYDVIVLNGWRTLTERKAIAYAKKHGIPYLFYINGGIAKTKENPLIKRMKTKYISGANLYFAPDERSADYLVHYGADESKIRQYPYSSIFENELVESPLSQEIKRELRIEKGLEGERVFLSSGQFIARKNYPMLIKAWTKAKKSDHLYIIGEGPLKPQYEKLIDQLGLANVHLMDFQKHDDLLVLFRLGDGFVFPSKEDIYGHVINEALSQGLPVIAWNNVNAASHLIRNGENGFVLNDDDPETLMSALDKIDDPKFAEGALEIARANTIEKSAVFHLSEFERAIHEELKR